MGVSSTPLPPGKKWIGGSLRHDFEAWAYAIDWRTPHAHDSIRVTVEDFKFAYNAWCTLRACLFYGLPHPRLLSAGRSTTPTLDIAAGGNRVFHMHCDVNQKPLFMLEASSGEKRGRTVKIALTPSHPRAVSIHSLDWASLQKDIHSRPVELVLGMENGLSAEVADACELCAYLPQYGSIGSLSLTSALVHAVHVAHTELHKTPQDRQTVTSASLGHKPASNDTTEGAEDSMPHEKTMIGWTNEQICLELARQRDAYPLQLSLVFDNQFADRNIGASVRNANAYNCEQVLVAGRRSFNHRGTVGTHLYTPVRFVENLSAFPGELEGYECWVVHATYPFVHNHYIDRAVPLPTIVGKKRIRSEFETFIRHDDERIGRWLSRHDPLHSSHPQAPFLKHVSTPPVFLDDEAAVMDAVRDSYRRRCRGIALLVHEDGTTVSPAMSRLAHRVCHLVHPRRLCPSQRGLPPALITAVALGVLRRAIDALC